MNHDTDPYYMISELDYTEDDLNKATKVILVPWNWVINLYPVLVNFGVENVEESLENGVFEMILKTIEKDVHIEVVKDQ